MEQPNTPQFPAQDMLPNSTLAIVSIVSALLGFTVLPVLGGIIALITGYMARKETRALPPTAGGDGLATAGIVMGWIQIVLLVVSVCCFVIYFVFVVGLAASGSG